MVVLKSHYGLNMNSKYHFLFGLFEDVILTQSLFLLVCDLIARLFTVF